MTYSHRIWAVWGSLFILSLIGLYLSVSHNLVFAAGVSGATFGVLVAIALLPVVLRRWN